MLVVGATGILAPLAATLARDGGEVVGVSRGGGRDTIAVDARETKALEAALRGLEWDEAVVYGPAVARDSLKWIRRSTPGRCVLVRTTASADPARGPLAVPPDTLQLGWTAEAHPRWHTPEEVSAAALEVLRDGRSRTLGTVRPWSDRP
ncbi:hypothetical protein ARHIZOSPH14_07360 [Agromyces rhizosphaerae]|uniref:Uncharacterized protein n=1 Tax=Agromyces rhizosphaerae TaxID=88374 RepID=A0A9W6CTE3_9MICO|nr:hypothetical protein ARHIZOSPH14_07360 [Agromyces rhizosphaerae]